MPPVIDARPLAYLSSAASTIYPIRVAEDPLKFALFSEDDEQYVLFVDPQVLRHRPLESEVAKVLTKLSNLRTFRNAISELPARCEAVAVIDEKPNDIAMNNAHGVIDALIGFPMEPDRVVASAEGGASVVFLKKTGRASLECLNNGDMVASIVRAGDKSPRVWEVTSTSVYAALATICDELGQR